MLMFVFGFGCAVLLYLLIGAAMGAYVVSTNLARFHAGGFQKRRMAQHVLLCMVAWPAAILE